MDAAVLADRITLRVLMQNHPDGSPSTLADAVGRSVSWVKKWRTRLRIAAPDDPTVLFGQSHAPHTRPDCLSQSVIDRILEIRDDPPDNLQRIPGPKAIQYYSARTPEVQGERLPRSSRTIWRVLKDAGRILIPGRGRRNRIARPAPMTEWELDFLDVVTVQADPDTDNQQHQVDALVVVDRGTSILLDCPLRTDCTMVTAIAAAADLVRTHGRPDRVRIDRDPRFVGGNAKAEILRDALPLRIVVRHHAPRAAAHHNIQHGIHHLPHIQAARSATRLCGRDHIVDTLPLAVGHIGWVCLCLHTPHGPHLIRWSSPFQTVSKRTRIRWDIWTDRYVDADIDVSLAMH